MEIVDQRTAAAPLVAAPGDAARGGHAPLSSTSTVSVATSLGHEAEALDEDIAFAQERSEFARLLRGLRDAHPGEGEGLRARPIGLALSGGGTRAASFHAGIFWSLASTGLLKEVGDLCAVSGGGYTAASYVSHICSATAPDPADPSFVSLDDWYRQIVARFVLRMQRNINYLVDASGDRQFGSRCPSQPEDLGSSCFPRILDLPLFIGALLGSMAASPALLLIHTVWPLVLAIELWHGATLRAAWCDAERAPEASDELRAWFFGSAVLVASLVVASCFLGTIIALGCVRRTPEHHRCYLFYRSLKHMLECGAVALSVYALSVASVLGFQVLIWRAAAGSGKDSQWVRALCHQHIVSSAAAASCSGFSPATGDFWYRSGALANYLSPEWAAEHAVPPAGAPSWDAGLPYRGAAVEQMLVHYAVASAGATGVVLAFVGLLLCRSKVLKLLGTIVIPLGYFVILTHLARWKVFGPITKQMISSSSLHYSDELSGALVWRCAVGAILTLPIFDVVQKFAHFYYRRSLQRAFFAGGRDINFSSIRRNVYCPNLLFGACLHDYRKPWETEVHVDFTISTLFLGCARTGFFSNPPQSSLAHRMTIAGAATDATFLLNADVLAIRFLLSVVALRFGDFVRLTPIDLVSRTVERRAVELSQQVSLSGGSLQDAWGDKHWIAWWIQGLRDRLPAAGPFFVAHGLVFAGVLAAAGGGALGRQCRDSRVVLSAALAAFGAIGVLSFFAYMKPLQWLMRSPMIQQLQMMCMHRYSSDRPPPYLYISDGGLLEPLGIMPLLRRRHACIIVSDAAEDPDLSMRCLRNAIAICREEGLCSFYDPRDERRDVEFALQAFRSSGVATLRLGIRYETGRGAEDGQLLYVRMRLPIGDDAPVRGLLTEEELLSPPPRAGASVAPAGGRPEPRRNMTGVCFPVCDCGGFCVGRQFPNFGVGNQFLTPLHFANLCSLGADLSLDEIGELRQSRQPP